MKFGLTPSPFQRSPRKTLHIMLELSLALVIVWIAAIIKNFVLYGANYGLAAFLVVFTSVFTTAVVDALVAIATFKPKPGDVKPGRQLIRHILKQLVTSFSYVTALILGLALPVGTPLYVVAIGAFSATFFGKVVFGGFGYNIFNPAVIGRIIVSFSYAGAMNVLLNSTTLGATPTGDFVKTLVVADWQALIPAGQTVWQVLGNYMLGLRYGALGETFTLLLIVIGVVLAIRNVLDWRLPVFYVGTFTITAAFFAAFNGFNIISYTAMQLVLGGLMYGAVFMVTDPVTTPTSRYGKALYGVIAGLLTFLIRTQGSYPEGVMYAIAITNMLTPLIDQSIKGMTTKKLNIRWGVIGGLAVFSLLINVLPLSFKAADARNAATSSESSTGNPYYSQLVSIRYTGNSTYEVVQTTYGGKNLTFLVEVDFAAKKIVNIVGQAETPVTPADSVDYCKSLFTYPNICVENTKVIQFFQDYFVGPVDIAFSDAKLLNQAIAEADLIGATFTQSGTRSALYEVAKRADASPLSSAVVTTVAGKADTYQVTFDYQWGKIDLEVAVDPVNEKVVSVTNIASTQTINEYAEDSQGNPVPDVFNTAGYLTNYLGSSLNISFADVMANHFDTFVPAESDPQFVKISATYTAKSIVLAIQAVILQLPAVE